MKWFRSLAACTAVAIASTLAPSPAPPATAAGTLVIAKPPILATAGQTLLLGDLFQLLRPDIVNFSVTLTGGLTFPGGGKTAGGSSIPVGIPVTATSSGTATIKVVALSNNTPVPDEATTKVEVRVPALLVTSRGRIAATPGQTLPLSAFFQQATGGSAVVRHTKIEAYTDGGGLGAFPNGQASFGLSGQPLSVFLNATVIVTGSGPIDIVVRAFVDDREFIDDARAYADISASPASTPNPATTPAPVASPAPTAPPAPPGSIAPAATVASTAPAPTAAPTPGSSTAPVPNAPAAQGGNLAPTAVGKSAVVKANTPTAITLKGTDPEGARLRYSVLDFPENGRLTGRAPTLSYVPDKGFVGTDAFTFTVNDGASTSEEAVITITVISAKTTVARKTTKGTKSAKSTKSTKKK